MKAYRGERINHPTMSLIDHATKVVQFYRQGCLVRDDIDFLMVRCQHFLEIFAAAKTADERSELLCPLEEPRNEVVHISRAGDIEVSFN
jgi:hypothetical protein